MKDFQMLSNGVEELMQDIYEIISCHDCDDTGEVMVGSHDNIIINKCHCYGK